MRGHPNDFHGVADQCMPGLSALMFHAMTMSDERGNSLMISLLGVAASLRDLGVNIAASTEVLASMFLLAQGREKTGADAEKSANQ